MIGPTTTWTYDLDGNRTQRTSSAGVEDYVYESGSRLTQVLLNRVETQRFEYDENGRVKRIVRIEDLNFVEELS